MKIRSLVDGPLEAVLFDFDGTLVDSVPDLAASVDAVLAEYGQGPAGEARVRDWVGRGAWNLIHRAFEFADASQHADAAYLRFESHYQAQCARNPVLYPGVAEGLARIQQQWPTALVTNKPMQYTTIMLDALDMRFDVVLGGDSVATKKPAPDMLQLACQRMGVNPARCVMVGDSSNDSEAAQALGMPVALTRLGYNHGNAVELAAPDLIYHDFLELLA
ncbi:phosphoglycolate phosphatase [Litorivicinus lipolyticus]|uniref:phosphoglycolate phosphatase n=1 Tax=Litorivicinus lipolyticus TaxID=418701 RepID=A0A5Q2QCS3_9GAMM|nr:phosphoglycolate phosphatase [Litorivicinus lipolyticus]QGG81103.1 phosphoglycolate phosphatase [Litorivicinus lipolyticus]